MPRSSKVELPGCPAFRALCCDNLGYTKVVDLDPGKGTPQVISRWGQPDGHQGILCTSYSDDNSQPGFAVARKNGRVEVLHPVSGVVLANVEVPTLADSAMEGSKRKREDASDSVCGIHLFKKSSFWGTSVLTCTEEGVAAIQRISYQDKEGDDNMDVCTTHNDAVDETSTSWSVTESGCVLCLQVDGTESYAIFGGKGVDVSLWDLKKCSQIWSAKNPRRDNLGLIAPSFVTSLTFLSKDDHEKFVVGTGQHQIRLYDAKAQRRPIMSFDYGESPIKSLTSDGDGYTVYVGTGNGDLACFDMRTGQNVGGFKGKIAGSVRSISRHPTLPLIASCGLDRFLRIHHTKTRQLLSLLFLKQQLVSTVFSTSIQPPLPPSDSTEKEILESLPMEEIKEMEAAREELGNGNSEPSKTTKSKRNKSSKTEKPEGLNKLSKTIKKSRKLKSSGP